MRLIAVLAFFPCIACESTPPPNPPPPRPPPATAPSPSAVPSPSASAPPISKETSPFSLVATGGQLRLFQLGTAAFVTEGCESGGPFASARLGPAGVTLDPVLTEGWDYCVFCMCEFQGSYPDRIYRAGPRDPSDGCTTQALNLKRGGGWKYVGGPGGGQLVVSPWSKGRKLVVGQDCGGYTQLAVLDAKTGLITRAKDAPSLDALGSQSDTRPGALLGFASFDSGEALMLTGPIFELPARLAIWRDGKRTPAVSTLSMDTDGAMVVFAGPTGIFLGAQTSTGPKLSHFDGRAWADVPVTGPTQVSLMRRAADGGLWIAGDDRLWHRGSDGTWSSMLLPSGLEVLELVEIAPGDVWLASAGALYRNRAATPVRIETECPGAFEGDVKDMSLARCKPTLVPLIED